MKKILLLVLSAISINNVCGQIDYKGFPQWSWAKHDSTEYYLYTPSNMHKDSVYPVAVFLHGCCGTSYHATLRNAVDPPVRMWHNFGANVQTIPTYIIAPATSRGWSQHIPNIKHVIDSIIEKLQGDKKRIYITGFSMGAAGTWEFIQQYPDYFAAAIPMGINFHGEHSKVKDIPVWTLRGQTDYWARNLHDDVWKIRKLNGIDADTLSNSVTGVNPMYTSFLGEGHNIQWMSASRNNLTRWAYSKINDGNNYPVVHFNSPSFDSVVKTGDRVPLSITATDSDGEISRVDIFVNGKRQASLTAAPYETTIRATRGDMAISATAVDNRNKTSTANTFIKTDVTAAIETARLPVGRQGEYYEATVTATGNRPIQFSVRKRSVLPGGVALSEGGVISGVPVETSGSELVLLAVDADGDSAVRRLRLSVKAKVPGKVVVAGAQNHRGEPFALHVLKVGVVTHSDNENDEVTISDAAGLSGLTMIRGRNADTASGIQNYMSFNIDAPATVYVAYEIRDNLFQSTIPHWLKNWTKTDKTLTAQYYYYDLYVRDFPAGLVTLPSPERAQNNVNNNYFVLVAPQK